MLQVCQKESVIVVKVYITANWPFQLCSDLAIYIFLDKVMKIVATEHYTFPTYSNFCSTRIDDPILALNHCVENVWLLILFGGFESICRSTDDHYRCLPERSPCFRILLLTSSNTFILFTAFGLIYLCPACGRLETS